MEEGDFFHPAYAGSNEFAQQNVRVTNATGFGSAADDRVERGIDLNEKLIRNKPATFFLRVNSDAMADAGIRLGDVVIVDRSLKANHGNVVIAAVEGELLIRKLECSGKKITLCTAGKNASVQDVTGGFKLWGVVTYVIHTL